MKEAEISSPATPAFQVLILEPDAKLSAEIVSALIEAKLGTSGAIATSVEEAQQLVIDQKPELFVLDVDANYDRAQEFIYDLRTSHPDARAIILTGSHFTAQRDQVAGLGAIHFLEKPFPRSDFIALAEALLMPASGGEAERFQGTLSDLHIADIIQLKCISGATSMLEFTGPHGEKAHVYFENGQVRHAAAPGKEGRAAFDEIVDWKGGMISEVLVPEQPPRTIDLDWQVLLMDAVRKIDEMRPTTADSAAADDSQTTRRKVLVIDDSVMLLSFVKEILTEQHYHVATAATAEEGLRESHNSPDLILLDYVLPDMKGDEVCRRLVADPVTSKIPVVYMSGFGSDLQLDPRELPNVIGSLSKPFTSESLISAVETYLGPQKASTESAAPSEAPIAVPVKPAEDEQTVSTGQPVPATVSLGETGAEPVERPEPAPATFKEVRPPFVPALENPPLAIPSGPIRAIEPAPTFAPAPPAEPIRESLGQDENFSAPSDEMTPPPIVAPTPPETRPTWEGPPTWETPPTSEWAKPSEAPLPSEASAYFCGDSSFFSLHWALQTIGREKLTGILRAFWTRDSIELLARDGRVVLVTTRNPQQYCEEAPVTLLNIAPERIEAARARQAEDGCPLFITLAQEGLILREPGLQLVQHYGQKLFAQLWPIERVRFVFEQQQLPSYADELSAAEKNVDQWALSTLRFVQYQELGKSAALEPGCIPAYTRDGYDRIQELRLTDAEAQFASQFNGVRSIAQISKNLRLDIKFARLSLFRFLALEIVDCWPAQLGQKTENRRGLRRIFGR
ncbi:MAG TPA: response regulator [Chthoniobacterales bacterium]